MFAWRNKKTIHTSWWKKCFIWSYKIYRNQHHFHLKWMTEMCRSTCNLYFAPRAVFCKLWILVLKIMYLFKINSWRNIPVCIPATRKWSDASGESSMETYLCHNVRNRTCRHVRPGKTQISLCILTVWSESSLGAFWIVKDAKSHHADIEDSDQTALMRRLIWVFVGRTCEKVDFLTFRFYLVCVIFTGIPATGSVSDV